MYQHFSLDLMILQNLRKIKLRGSSIILPAHGSGGARARDICMVANFFRRNAGSEGAAEGGFKGGIPPRPSVPPERSGGGQFFSKKVRAFSNKGHQIGLRDFLWGEAEVCSPRRTARRANYRFGFQKITKSNLVRPDGLEPSTPTL